MNIDSILWNWIQRNVPSKTTEPKKFQIQLKTVVGRTFFFGGIDTKQFDIFGLFSLALSNDNEVFQSLSR